MREFTLRLEFEAFGFGPGYALLDGVATPDWDRTNDFCFVRVDLADGRRYALNVWTFSVFTNTLQEAINTGDNLSGLYIVPPDLFVKELTRDCITATITDLLSKGDLERILNPSILVLTSNDD